MCIISISWLVAVVVYAFDVDGEMLNFFPPSDMEMVVKVMEVITHRFKQGSSRYNLTFNLNSERIEYC